MLLEAPQSQTSHYKCQQESVCCRKECRRGCIVFSDLIFKKGKIAAVVNKREN